MTISPLLPFVTNLVLAWHSMVEDNVAWLTTMLLHATLDIHHSVSLLVAPTVLECALAFQGNISLHDATISELIFELLESQQPIDKASKDTRSKDCCPLWKRFKLKGSVWKWLMWKFQNSTKLSPSVP